jgi:hypothetical protein
MVVGGFAGVSEMRVASIFGVEVCEWAYCCVYIAFWFEKEVYKGSIEWGLVPFLGQQERWTRKVVQSPFKDQGTHQKAPQQLMFLSSYPHLGPPSKALL